MKRPRVLLADDHLMLLEGLSNLLQPHFDVVGVVLDGRDVVDAVKRLDPDVLVLEISMPYLSGIDVASQLRRDGCRAKIVFLTMHRDATYAARAIEAGAAGFVIKHSAAGELVAAIHEVLKAGTYIAPQIASQLPASLQRKVPSSNQTLDKLTPRQQQVLRLVVEGRSAKDVAVALDISTRTAEFHKARLMKTLGVQNMAELIKYAIRAGISFFD